MSVEGESNDHHAVQHIALVKLSPLPTAPSYSIRVLSAYIPSGMTSRVHFHSGVEAIYTVDGEQCVETKDRAIKIEKGAECGTANWCHDAPGGGWRKATPGLRGDRLRLIQVANHEDADGKSFGTCFLHKVTPSLFVQEPDLGVKGRQRKAQEWSRKKKAAATTIAAAFGAAYADGTLPFASLRVAGRTKASAPTRAYLDAGIRLPIIFSRRT
jgi:hypothetical protein